ncbi:hypothetical protein LCGC14_1746430 [marine sediment metagenome]|uniref:Uncharacterized protein n=1 Tax=marine sediment metagenome TaxID=412755 RepID=A0A0F9K4L1_9ZZZZ
MINKKSQTIFQLFVWLAIGFVLVIMLALFNFSFNLITGTLQNVTSTNSFANISEGVDATFGQINPAMQRAHHTYAFVTIFMLAISIFITNFLIKVNPVFFVAYIFVVITAVIVSVILSNQYEILMTSSLLGGTISEFTAASWIMLQLPIWTSVVGIIGAVFLFAGIIRDRGSGGSIT